MLTRNCLLCECILGRAGICLGDLFHLLGLALPGEARGAQRRQPAWRLMLHGTGLGLVVHAY